MTTGREVVVSSPSAGRLARLVGLADYWWTIWRRTWRGQVVTAVVTPLLYVVAIGVVLGGFVDTSGTDLGAPSYLAFVAGGLLAGQAMLLGCAEATWPVFGRIVHDRTYEAMLATPLDATDVALSNIVAAVVRAGALCAVFALVLVPFGVFSGIGGFVLAVAAQFVVAWAFVGPVYAFTAGLTTGEAFQVLYRFGQIPLYLFSGAFFPVGAMPEAAQVVAWATPLFHGVELTRMAMLGPWQTGPAVVHLAYLLGLGVVGSWLGVRRLRRRMSS